MTTGAYINTTNENGTVTVAEGMAVSLRGLSVTVRAERREGEMKMVDWTVVARLYDGRTFAADQSCAPSMSEAIDAAEVRAVEIAAQFVASKEFAK